MTIGQSIPRLEDRRFLTGQGCFTDDLQFANALHAVVDVPAALAADAPSVWDDVPGNRCVTWRQGDTAAVDAAFAAAAHVVSLTAHNNRLVGNSIEPRVAIGGWDAANDRAELHTASQGVHLIRRLLCDDVFGWPYDKLRVVTPDVGGGFGPKYFLYPE